MIKQFRIAFELKPGSSILTFRARHVPNAPEGCLEARWRDWHLTILLTNFSRICQKMPKYFFEIDVGGVRMDCYGSVWTRMGPYGPWGLPGGFLGPPGALGGPERGVKGGSPPGGGARGALLGGLPISLRGILTYMALRAAYGTGELRLRRSHGGHHKENNISQAQEARRSKSGSQPHDVFFGGCVEMGEWR